MTTRSGPIRSNHACATVGGSTAAPCRMNWMLDRSRLSIPGTRAIRCSIVGVAVNVVMRCRSIRSTTCSASNFCSRTISSPPSIIVKQENPFVWYSGARPSMRWGRSIVIQLAPNGTDIDGTHAVGRSVMITFGVPVEPLLQMPLVCMPMTSATASSGWDAASVISSGTSSGRMLSRPATTSSSRSRSHAGRSQRTGTGTAPSFQAAKTSNTSSVELTSSMATQSPLPTPRSANVRASCSLRRSTSRQVNSSSLPSGKTTTSAGSSGRAAAMSRSRRLNGMGVSSSTVNGGAVSGADAGEAVAQARRPHDPVAALGECVVLRLLQMLARDARGFLRLAGTDRVDERLVGSDDVAPVFLDRILPLRLRALRPLPLLLGPQTFERADHQDQRLVAAPGDEIFVELPRQRRELRPVADCAFTRLDVGLQLRDHRLLPVGPLGT